MGDNSHSPLSLDVSEGQLPRKPVPAPQAPAHCSGANLHGLRVSRGGGATSVQRGYTLVEGHCLFNVRLQYCSARFKIFVKSAISKLHGVEDLGSAIPVKCGHSLVEDNLGIWNNMSFDLGIQY